MPRVLRIACLSGFMVVLAVASTALRAAEATHAPALLAGDASLTLAEVIRSAAARHPDVERLAGLQAQADAFAYAADYPLAASPSLVVSHLRDAPGEDVGGIEYEVGLQMPFKWFGQGAAQRRLAERARELTSLDGAALLWRVAGLVRTTLWELRLAQAEHRHAVDAVAAAKALTEAVRTRVRLGDLPRADAVLAEGDHVERESALLASEGQLADVQRRYSLITGLDHYPLRVEEEPDDAVVIAATHPALRAADALVQRFSAERDTRGMTNAITFPQLNVGPRHQRSARGQSWDDSVGVSLQYPFGLGPQGRIEAASAIRDATEALVAQRRLERELAQALGEAQHELHHARLAMQLAARRLRLAEQHEVMARVAFEEGETDLAEYLRVRAAGLRAQRDLSHWTLRAGWAAANLNQALGVLPDGLESTPPGSPAE